MMMMTSTVKSSMFESNLPSDVSYQSKLGRKKTRRDDDKCLVCGNQAIGVNFGVHSCSPCKAFFRRTAVRLGTHEFTCRSDGDCLVTNDTRRQCNCCRLAKCFRVGMNPKAIRTLDQRLERFQLVQYNREKLAEKRTALIRPSNLLIYNCLSLSATDQTRLTNIFSAYEQTCVTLRYHQLLNMPNDSTLSLGKCMNSCTHMYMALIKYFKFVPEFANLSLHLKISLVKSNLNLIIRLNSPLVMQATGNAESSSSVAFIHLFPPDLYFELRKCSLALLPFANDSILLKLILIVMMFSTPMTIRYENNSIDDEDDCSTLNILTVQNVYVELLWRYILYRSSNSEQAIKLFSSFITRLIYSQSINIKLNEHISKIVSNQTDQLDPIMRAMWLDEQK